MLMDLDNLAGTSDSHAALDDVAAEIGTWLRKHAETKTMLEGAVKNAKSTLFSGDIAEAKDQLEKAGKSIDAVRTLADALSRPTFLTMPPAKQNQVGKQVQAQMWFTANAVRATIDAVRRAETAAAERDVTIAEVLLKADKFVADVVPEVVGAIATAITLNKKAGKAIENADKVIQRGATELSYMILQDGKAGGLDSEIGSLQDKVVEGLIDTAAAFVPGEAAGFKGALRTLATCMIRDAMKARIGKEGEEANKAMIAGATEGFFSAVEDIGKELPAFKDKQLRQKVLTALLKTVSGGAKALAEDKPVGEGLVEGAAKGAVAVASESAIHNMSGHGGSHAGAAPAHGAPAHGAPALDLAAIIKARDAWVQSTFSIKIYPAQ